jgi:aspartate-semialdehyde dehydrogenase
MVGSVLVQRMREERDFDAIEPVFFSTSQAGAAAPAIGKRSALSRTRRPVELTQMDVLISCQGGDYTPRSTRSCASGLGRLLDRRRVDAGA